MPDLLSARGNSKTYVHWHNDGTFTIHKVQDIEDHLNFNKAAQNHNDGYLPGKTMRRAASIPNVVIAQWLKEGIDVFNQNHWPKVRQKLNSNEFRHLRTANFQI